jgi:FADH2 O2-dependent halogenase
MKFDFDVAIIGGGPAGSATASYLAKGGLKCIVLESEIFPRPHVGESLVPAATRVFREIGFLEKLDRAGFVRKYGAVWTATEESTAYAHDWEGLAPDCCVDIRFEEREQEGVDRTYTYHVDRGKFDELLLTHAKELGATVWQGCRVTDIDLSDPKRPRIDYIHDEDKGTLNIRLIADASGRSTVLGRKLKLRVVDTVFNQYASHTWFDGYDRTILDAKGGHDESIFIHFLPISNSWIWQIPITDTITSIGVVTQKKNFQKSKQSREDFFWECMNSRPKLYDALKASIQLRPFTEEADYSYGMKEICGDGFVLVGDAARFVDPIFSSGVSIALNGAKLVSADILSAAESGEFSKRTFENYETIMRRGTKNWYEFINIYYRLNILFTAFIQDPRYRLDILKLLQGDVYDEIEPPVLKRMRDMVSTVEQNERHIWHDLLGELTSHAFEPEF